MKIIITGGHVTPAIAVIEELRKYKNVEIIFVGKKYNSDFENTLSFEYKLINNLNVKFVHLSAGRLTRILSLKSLISFLKFPIGFIQAIQIIKKERVQLILSFGGFIALPIALIGWISNIPVYTHEQTLIPGLTNRFIGIFAKKIFISFPSTKKFFDVNKTILTGNPLRKDIFYSKKITNINIDRKRLTIYVTGGSLGSHSLNMIIKSILDKLLLKFNVIHQTGDTNEYQDFEKLTKIKEKNYFLRKHFYDQEIGYVYSITDIVISRAGANTIFELIALKKPAVFIPLPWSSNQEQKTQAEFLKNKGVSEIFYQNGIEPSEYLYSLIVKMANNLNIYKGNFKKLEEFHKKYAAKTINDHILPKI